MTILRTFIFAGVMASAPAVASDTCASLRTIAAEVGGNFQSLRGTPVKMTENWTYYQGTEIPAGAAKCDVNTLGADTYECDWPVGSQGELKAKQAELVNVVRQCLPQAYSAKTLEGEIAFWVGVRRQPGAFEVRVRPMKVHGDRYVSVTVGAY